MDPPDAAASESSAEGSDSGESKESFDDITITEEFQQEPAASPALPSPISAPPSPPTPLHLAEDVGDGNDVSFSTLSSSIASLHTAITRLSQRLDHPQPVYIVGSAAQQTIAQPPPAQSPRPDALKAMPPPSPSPRPAVARASGRRRPRGSLRRSSLSPSVDALIDRQQQLMSDLLALLALPENARVPLGTRRPRDSGRGSRSGEESPFRHLHVEEEWWERPHPDTAPPSRRASVARRSEQAPSASPLLSSRRASGSGSPPPGALDAPVRSHRGSAASSAPDRARLASTVHPPLPPTLSAQLDALRRKEEKWKSRLRTNKTQRMREDLVRLHTREEDEERRQRDEDEQREHRRKALIDTAMRERWGRRPSSDSIDPQPSPRIEWIKRRDQRPGRPPADRRPSQSPPARAGRTEKALESSPRRSGLKDEESRSLFTADHLRALGFADVADSEDDEDDGWAAARDVEKEVKDEEAASTQRVLQALGLRH